MTEDEAKQKWCPQARPAGQFDAQNNRSYPITANRDCYGKADTSAMCLASGCMAWRWRTDNIGRTSEGEMVPVYGYCGLAGKP